MVCWAESTEVYHLTAWFARQDSDKKAESVQSQASLTARSYAEYIRVVLFQSIYCFVVISQSREIQYRSIACVGGVYNGFSKFLIQPLYLRYTNEVFEKSRTSYQNEYFTFTYHLRIFQNNFSHRYVHFAKVCSGKKK